MNRWRLSKAFRFEASHRLERHDGKCARLHGHSWVGWVHFEGQRLEEDGPQTGMVLDYGRVDAVLGPVLERLDHYHLNDVLQTDSPTSEVVARWMYLQLAGQVPGLASVVLEENCTSRCEYWGPANG